MIGFALEFDVTPWRDGLRKLPRLLDTEVERALRATTRAVRAEAKRSHGYQDRTGRLTRSITTYPTEGRFTADDLEGTVVATQHYASYVEEGTTRARAFRYLGSAYALQERETTQRFEDALERALDRSGLR